MLKNHLNRKIISRIITPNKLVEDEFYFLLVQIGRGSTIFSGVLKTTWSSRHS